MEFSSLLEVAQKNFMSKEVNPDTTITKSIRVLAKRFLFYKFLVLGKINNWLTFEISRIKKSFSIWPVFWLFVVTYTCLFFFLELIKNSTDLYKNFAFLFSYSGTFLTITLLGLFCLIGIFIFIAKPGAQLNKQELHKQPSWVFYSYWGIINALILLSLVLYLIENKSFWRIGLWGALIIILIKWVNEFLGQKVVLEFTHFAASAVGKNNDKFDFNLSAKNAAESIIKLDNYINVVGIYGGLGFGKSSYSRMVIENFDSKKFLYTYISLTETNEAKDFSKLFAERWLDTLSERYPKIDVTSYLPFMDSIIRESGNGILSDLLKVISNINRGLVKTKSSTYDKNYATNKPQYTSDKVAKLFGNITEIEEQLWIIMIDEIERARFDEIYRLIEIVERLKNEGRSGLPIKLLFIFCISEPELENYLNDYAEHNDTRVRLLKTFFYEDPKSITHKIFLPSVDPAIKQKYVLDSLNKIIEKENLKTPAKISPHAISDPSHKFMNHKDAMEHTVALLTENSPRIISRISNALEFFYGAFRDRAGEIKKDAIRFNDIVVLEYIKIKYPFLIDFFTKTIHILVNQTEERSLSAYLTKEDLKEKKIDLIGWIELSTGRKITDAEKPDILKLVGLVMYYYFDFLNKDYDTKSKQDYFGTTSYPEVMCDYLSLVADGIETNYRENNRIYLKHKSNSENIITTLKNKEILNYSRFIFDVPNAPIKLNMDVIYELSNRIISQKIKLEPMNIGDTLLDDAAYLFIFQIVAVAEKYNIGSNDNILKKAFESLKSILSSPMVNTGIKYIMLNSFVNHERGSNSSIHSRLETAYTKISSEYEQAIKKTIESVFTEAENRYLNGEEILYEKEENFFYVLYQGWSGSKDSIEEIVKIRNAAKRNLENYPKAIKLYWNNYPIEDGWKTYDDVLKNNRDFEMRENNYSLYMPLEDLIAITKQSNINNSEIQAKLKFWDSIKDIQQLKKFLTINDDKSTLKSYLVRNGFLNHKNKNVTASGQE